MVIETGASHARLLNYQITQLLNYFGLLCPPSLPCDSAGGENDRCGGGAGADWCTGAGSEWTGAGCGGGVYCRTGCGGGATECVGGAAYEPRPRSSPPCVSELRDAFPSLLKRPASGFRMGRASPPKRPASGFRIGCPSPPRKRPASGLGKVRPLAGCCCSTTFGLRSASITLPGLPG